MSSGCGPPMMIMKVKMIMSQKVMMTIMIRYLETHQVDPIHLGEPEVVMDMWNPKDPWDEWPLHL